MRELHPSVASSLSLFLAVITGAGDGIGKAYAFEVSWPLFFCGLDFGDQVLLCLTGWISCLGFLNSWDSGEFHQPNFEAFSLVAMEYPPHPSLSRV